MMEEKEKEIAKLQEENKGLHTSLESRPIVSVLIIFFQF